MPNPEQNEGEEPTVACADYERCDLLPEDDPPAEGEDECRKLPISMINFGGSWASRSQM